MYLINLSKQAEKFFSKLPSKQFKQIVKEIFALAKNPEQNDIKKIKSNSEYQYYRKDIGEYRVIYRYNTKVLYITVAGKRNDDEVYKIFDRR